jgi:hypothetical protein
MDFWWGKAFPLAYGRCFAGSVTRPKTSADFAFIEPFISICKIASEFGLSVPSVRHSATPPSAGTPRNALLVSSTS